jgi:hypothetical protein
MEKRGASHVEVVISFVLFFTFVSFLLFYIKPFSDSGISNTIIFTLHDSFKEQTQTDLTEFFLKADSPDDCFSISLQGLDISDGGSIVKPVNEGEAASSLINNKLSVENKGDFYNVFISPEFSNSFSLDCVDFENYTIGSIKNKKPLYYQKIQDIEEEYYDSYDSLKSKLKISESYDFAIISDIAVMEKNIPEGMEVFAVDYIEEVLKENGVVSNEKFLFKIW